MSKNVFVWGEKISASSPLLHVICRPRGTFFKVGVRGGGLKCLRSDRAKQVGRKLAWSPGAKPRRGSRGGAP